MKDAIFEERQFIGANKHTLSLRIFLAIICFAAYYFTDVPELNGDLLFMLGIVILVISVLLLFVTHIHTVIKDDNLMLESFLGTGKVNIPLDTVSSAEKIKYSTYLINNPVYNLHRDRVIRFYSGGKDAVKITMKNGMVYIIGTGKPEELVRVVGELARKV